MRESQLHCNSTTGPDHTLRYGQIVDRLNPVDHDVEVVTRPLAGA